MMPTPAQDEHLKQGKEMEIMGKSTGREFKNFDSLAVKVVDEDQGIVEHFFSVFGNTDLVGDIVHPGSFTKTLAERGMKVKVLDMHNRNSVLDVIGKPMVIVEVDRSGLPQELLMQYPDATGAVKARTQFLLDTPEGKGAFARIKAGAIDEWSFGFDVMKKDYSKDAVTGDPIRNIREVRLWEYGPVIFGANPATMTTGVKSEDGLSDDEIPVTGGIKIYNGKPAFWNQDEKRALTLAEVAFELNFKGQFVDGFYELMSLLDIAVFSTLNDENMTLVEKEAFVLKSIDEFSGLANQFVVGLFQAVPKNEDGLGEAKISETEVELSPATPDPVDQPISDDGKADTWEHLMKQIQVEKSINQNFEIGD